VVHGRGFYAMEGALKVCDIKEVPGARMSRGRHIVFKNKEVTDNAYHA
jgi:hypothetical protein